MLISQNFFKLSYFLKKFLIIMLFFKKKFLLFDIGNNNNNFFLTCFGILILNVNIQKKMHLSSYQLN